MISCLTFDDSYSYILCRSTLIRNSGFSHVTNNVMWVELNKYNYIMSSSILRLGGLLTMKDEAKVILSMEMLIEYSSLSFHFEMKLKN